jgi:tricarballylate dehydrogenase
MVSTQRGQENVVIIGGGIAGLSAAVAAAERSALGGVTLVERAKPHEAGGNTRWTSAFFRMDDIYDPGANFTEDIISFSGGKTSEAYVRRLAETLPEAMEWVQSHGVRFRKAQTYFINSSRARLQPVGGGEELVRRLTAVALSLGVNIQYETTALGLVTDPAGEVTAVRVDDGKGERLIDAKAVIIASGGFEGNPAIMEREVGDHSRALRLIAPGCAFNQGEGIEMALQVGAQRGGEWDNFHAEPVDPRSADAEALVMVFPYGILVNKQGRRFVDEGSGTVDEIYEGVAREISRQQDNLAYFITDEHFKAVTARDKGILTSVRPYEAGTLAELAEKIGVDSGALAETVSQYNAATTDGHFDWRAPDGLSTSGLDPEKSNWAFPLTSPPFIAYPVSCSVVFTFGGLGTDSAGHVLRLDGAPFANLYAAGECTGIYYSKYPGGTSVMRGLAFGRLVGISAAGQMDALPSGAASE